VQKGKEGDGVVKTVLIAGESWITHSVHIKGSDHFTTDSYEEGVHWLRQALERAGYAVEYLPNHLVPSRFPVALEGLRQYAGVIFSDVGSNSLLLNPESFVHARPTANRLDLLADYVAGGGGFAMVGGYMSFAGIEGKARYAGTAIERILPVQIATVDDRIELPQGRQPEAVLPAHPIIRGLPGTWPAFLGYNRLMAKAEGEVLVRCGDDPFLVAGSWGRGRAMAFASDCGPHWAPPVFLEWEYHDRFWAQALDWLTSGAES
jgi:uncharacterized membrane protein